MQWPINGRVSHVVNVLFNSPHAPAPVCLSVKIKYITCALSWSRVIVKEIYGRDIRPLFRFKVQ